MTSRREKIFIPIGQMSTYHSRILYFLAPVYYYNLQYKRPLAQ